MTRDERSNVVPRENGYIRRFSRVIEYMYAHLDEDPDLATLASIAALSPWHFHRIWQSTYGESVVAAVKRHRLHRAAADLTYTDLSMARVAQRAGYGSLEAFSRSFKQVYGQSPSQYRTGDPSSRLRPANGGAPVCKPTGPLIMKNVEIRNFPSENMAVIPHQGSYMEIGQAFEQLIGVLVNRGQIDEAQAIKAVYLSDPTHVPEKDLKSVAGAVVPDGFPIEAPLESYTSAGGDYAVVRHKGPYSDLKATYEYLYGDWLQQSGRLPADNPCIEIYLNNPRDTTPADLLTDVCLPLKPV